MIRRIAAAQVVTEFCSGNRAWVERVAGSASALALVAAFTGCSPTAPSRTLAEAVASAPGTPGPTRCDALNGTTIGTATITRAQAVRTGAELIPLWKRLFFRMMISGPLPELSITADMCRVTATLKAAPDSNIATEVWLPDRWNGKLLGVGGGGFNGGLSTAALTLRVASGQGYAGVATNVGHDDTESAEFAYESRQQYVDYAFQGNHVSAQFAKSLIEAYYGTPTKRAYFHGCSNGGRDALMEARRFPDDYDGILAGAPAAGWSKLMTSFAWNARATSTAPNLKKKLETLQAAVVAKCDSLDGITDRWVENPQACAFDPGELQCRGADDARCLNGDEVAAVRKIYAGPHLQDGTRVFSGMPVGGEALPRNWEDWIVGEESAQSKFASETFRWMVYRKPDWTLDDFDIDRDYPAATKTMGSVMDSDDPSLDSFVRRGGKLILYHGWNDAAIPAGATIDYYERVQRALGSAADAHVRLFMVPGLMHCLGGPGLTDFDLLAPLDRWVESGTAPERVTARQTDPATILTAPPGAKVVRSRPLCPWPQVARYSGTGSSNDAANFVCK